MAYPVPGRSVNSHVVAAVRFFQDELKGELLKVRRTKVGQKQRYRFRLQVPVTGSARLFVEKKRNGSRLFWSVRTLASLASLKRIRCVCEPLKVTPARDVRVMCA